MKNKKKVFTIIVLAFLIVCAMVSTTMAVYTKTLPFLGNITLNHTPTPNDWLIYNFKKMDSATANGGNLQLNGRNDVLKKFYIGKFGYQIDVDCGASDLKNWGIYISGWYDSTTQQSDGVSLQYTNGDMLHFERNIDFTTDGNSLGTEKKGTNVLNYSSLSKQVDISKISISHHMRIIMRPNAAAPNTNSWYMELYIDGVQMKLLKTPYVIPNLGRGEYAYLGARSWGVKNGMSFRNFTVTPLKPTPDQIGENPYPQLVMPYSAIAWLADQTVTPGTTMRKYFAGKPTGQGLDSERPNYGPTIKRELVLANLGAKPDDVLTFRVIKGKQIGQFQILFTQNPIADLKVGDTVEQVYRYDTVTKKLQKGSCKINTKNLDSYVYNILDEKLFVSQSEEDLFPDTDPQGLAYNQNFSYQYTDYQSKTAYSYHQVVRYGQVLYRCVNPEYSSFATPGQWSADSIATWQVVGTPNGDAVPFSNTHCYALGTIVSYQGGYYMYAPIDNNARGYAGYAPGNNAVWLSVTSQDPKIRPAKADTVYQDAVSLSYVSQPLKKGGLYVLEGVLYRYEGTAGEFSGNIYLDEIKSGTWQLVPMGTYWYKNASYKAGDKVWYQGLFYKATKSFITDYSAAYRPNEQNGYWTISN